MRNRLYRVLLWACVLGMMAVIFFFSAQPGAESDKLTEAAAMPIAELIAAVQAGDDEAFVLHVYNIAGTILRKTAHVAEYALLGLLLRLLCRSCGREGLRLPFLIGVGYAISDEVHQLFVPGRLGAFTDVLIDAVGVLIGLISLTMIDKLRRNHHVHHQ